VQDILLFHLCKLTERFVKRHLTDHLQSNSLVNSFQSACTKFHSTETTRLAVHDNIISATSLQQITCLCLLDLPSAFDTGDHNVLLCNLTLWVVRDKQHCFGLDKILSLIMLLLC
jgi:hypothetical protein